MLTTPAFSNSIFTLDPTLPLDVQVIVGVEPGTQDSPPFGEVTVIAETEESADTVPGNSMINAINPIKKKIFLVFVVYRISAMLFIIHINSKTTGGSII